MTNVAVCVRFRPHNSKERQQRWDVIGRHRNDQQSFTFKDEYFGEATFSFDRIFYEDCTQADVYDIVALPIVRDAMNAINGTILAYGQTGAGKTHTMEGPNILTGSNEMKGILPRVAQSIFGFIEAAVSTSEFIIKLSMVEIYKERIRDLFDSSKDNLQVKEDKAHGIFVGGATETYVQSEQDMLKLLEAGIANRATGASQMNSRSSRSHCVCLVTIQQINTEDQSLKTGKLYLVDLAGSEKLEKTGAEGSLLEEAKTINKSLSALGNVINSLTTDKAGHIPYRDSKLTRILQESLGGNSTTLLCCCSPSSLNSAETLSTLRFGTRAKQIKNKPKINAQPGQHHLELLLEKSREECELLRSQFLLLNARLGERTEGTRLENGVDIFKFKNDRVVPNCDKLLQRLHQSLFNKKVAPTCDDIISGIKDLFIAESVIPSKNQNINSVSQSPSKSQTMVSRGPNKRMEVDDNEYSKPKKLSQRTSLASSDEPDDDLDVKSANHAVDKALLLLQKAVEDLGRKCENLILENGELKIEMVALTRLLAQSEMSKRPLARSNADLRSELPTENCLQNSRVVYPVRGNRQGISLPIDNPNDVASAANKPVRSDEREKIPVWSSIFKMFTGNLLWTQLSPLSL